jgi:hypothetical protein
MEIREEFMRTFASISIKTLSRDGAAEAASAGEAEFERKASDFADAAMRAACCLK